MFSFACYNSCLEYKDDSSRKGKLIKPGLQILFTLMDENGTVFGEDSIDLRVCACPTRDAPFNGCHGSSRHLSAATCPSNAQTTVTRQKGPSGNVIVISEC